MIASTDNAIAVSAARFLWAWCQAHRPAGSRNHRLRSAKGL